MAGENPTPESGASATSRPPETDSSKMKRYINRAFFIGAAVYSAFHAGFVIWNTARGNDRIINMVYEHFAAIVGLPFVGFAALGLVLLLESRSDEPIEFNALGFVFKGASGPIVLWVLCFLAIVVSLKALW